VGLPCLTYGTPTIEVGHHILVADTPGQVVRVHVEGGDSVQGVTFNLQIADGGPEAGGEMRGPVIRQVDLLTNTVFATNNTGQRDLGSFPQIAIHATTTAAGSVPASGLLATVTIDTTGVTNGVFALSMSNTLNGATDFAGIPANIPDGSITVEQTGSPSLGIAYSNSAFVLTFDPVPGRSHEVDRLQDLESGSGWTVLPGAPHDAGVAIDTNLVSAGFYRLRVSDP
jgi:hypothetical protein